MILLKLKVSETATDLNLSFKIDGEGLANLKRLKRIYVAGLTIGELVDILNKEYSKFVIEPDVEIEIIEYRPVTVYVDREVVEPGVYTLPGSSINSEEDTIVDLKTEKYSAFPTIMDFLRKSKGITMYSNLKEIKIIRKNNITSGGGKISTTINLLKLLDLKDFSSNLRLVDGDIVFIPKTDEPLTVQMSKVIKTNINPKFINVFLAGRVELPGTIRVNKSSTLSDVIEISGGIKIVKGKVKFIRYNNDGTIDLRKFAYMMLVTLTFVHELFLILSFVFLTLRWKICQ